MKSYVVSALKYRPQTFQSVVGQDALTATLKNAIISNKLAHAYLFCGPRGVGKTTCARIFAKTINCETLTAEHEACNECQSCRTFNEQRSFNIHELDAASNNSVDDIRVLTEQVRIPPQLGKYSVYIIDEVHMLSQGAFNAFLKTLEEPPAHAIFILATTEKHKIIPTILSRCQIYDFNRISVTDTVSHIRFVAKQEGVTIDENALNVIAQKSDGGMRDALSIFDQLVSFSGYTITYQSTIENLNVLDYEYYFRLVDYALEGNVSQSLLLFNEVLNKGFEAQHFISGFSSHLRDLLVSKDPVTIQLLEVGANIGERYKRQAAAAPVDFLFNALNISNECDLNYRVSKNKRLLVELTLIKICQLVGNKKKVLTEPVDKPIQKVEAAPKPATETETETATTEIKSSKTPSQTASSQSTGTTTTASITVDPKPHAQAAPKPAINDAIPNIPRSISISNFKSETNTPTTVTESTTVLKSNSDFTIEDLLEKWKDFSRKEEIDPGTRALLNSHLPTKIDEKTIEVFVDNKFQEKELIQMDILSHLRKTLNNSDIRLKIELTPESEQKRPQTPQDIYKRMINDNPVLEKLRKNLDMEID
ncbi:MAG: DNA polymerase III subunit gamma/tau [Porphyromonadaceae bacterium]|nr:DNA polymerase III subunit gamma/tau [Porphyromonadaceae bacterium]